MRYRVLIHPQAEAELRDAFAFIWADSPVDAERWRDGLLKKAASLASVPCRCPLAPQSAAVGREIRQLLYGRKGRAYRLLFMVEAGQVTILHVRHWGRRALGSG